MIPKDDKTKMIYRILKDSAFIRLTKALTRLRNRKFSEESSTLIWTRRGALATEKTLKTTRGALTWQKCATFLAILACSVTIIGGGIAICSLNTANTTLENEALGLVASNRLAVESLLISNADLAVYIYGTKDLNKQSLDERTHTISLGRTIIATFFFIYQEASRSPYLKEHSKGRLEVDLYILNYFKPSSEPCYLVNTKAPDLPDPGSIYDSKYLAFLHECGCNGSRTGPCSYLADSTSTSSLSSQIVMRNNM
jgi:hypothetical protein